MSSRTFATWFSVLALLGAAWFGPRDWITAAFLLFGLGNVLFAPAGTLRVRAAAIVACLAALVVRDFRMAIAVTLVLTWPPAYLLSWTAAEVQASPDHARAPDRVGGGYRARLTVGAVIISVAIASLVFRLLVEQQLQQTAALFVGLPTLLAVIVVFAVSPRSATGVACKAVTVGLLVSLIFLGEGILCVLMSAPLFYGVAVAIGAGTDLIRLRLRDRSRTAMSCVAVLALVPMSLEGVSDATSLRREEQVTVTRVIASPTARVADAVMRAPRFDRALPHFLRAGFPRPVSVRIDRDGVSPRWVIGFRGGEMRLDGIEPHPGDLILELEHLQPGLARWRALSDGSHMTHFLEWRESVVRWEPVDASTTRVEWTVRYRRGLDPAWYFGPWERYAARLAASYLIESVATP